MEEPDIIDEIYSETEDIISGIQNLFLESENDKNETKIDSKNDPKIIKVREEIWREMKEELYTLRKFKRRIETSKIEINDGNIGVIGKITYRKDDDIFTGRNRVYGGTYQSDVLDDPVDCAIKKISIGKNKNGKKQLRRAKLEVKIMNVLKHPNIIKYYGNEFDSINGEYFIAMPRCSMTLEKYSKI